MKSRYEFLCDKDLLSSTSISKNTVDLVLTDPPYLISKGSGMQSYRDSLEKGGEEDEKYGKKYAISTDFGEWDNSYTIEDLEHSIKEFYRILKPGGSCIIFFDIWKIETLRNLLNKFTKHRFIEWVKTNPVPINQRATYLSNAREIAISCVKGGKATFNSKYDKGIYEYLSPLSPHNSGIYEYPIYGGKDRFHPTQKSLRLFEELIKKHTNEGDVVVDPYAGSGTTALAAKNTNRIYICGEPSEEYFQRGYDRVKN